MGKHLSSKTHKAQLDKLAQSDVILLTGMASNEQALVVLKKKGSHGVIVASYSHQIQADYEFKVISIILTDRTFQTG